VCNSDKASCGVISNVFVLFGSSAACNGRVEHPFNAILASSGALNTRITLRSLYCEIEGIKRRNCASSEFHNQSDVSPPIIIVCGFSSDSMVCIASLNGSFAFMSQLACCVRAIPAIITTAFSTF
jgi:hypothetical protein